jgi:hypothetical protein
MTSKTTRSRFSLRHQASKFAPISLNLNRLRSEQLLSLYKFGNLLLPGVPFDRAARTMLDFEHETHRALLNISPQERKQLQEGLQGLSIELKIAISDASFGEIISVPIRIEPSAVMERAILGKGENQTFEKEIEEMKKFLFDLIKKEAKRKTKEVFEAFFKNELLKTGWKHAVKEIKELVKLGAITRQGQLAPNTTIEELLVGKYSKIFAKVTNEEVLNEGLLIHQTLAIIYEWAELTPEEWEQEVRHELNLIEATLEVIKSKS